MVANLLVLYFYDDVANVDGKYVVHTIQCSNLLHNREYIGIAPSSPLALHRAEDLFPEKSFVLCPDCCKKAKFDKNNK